MRLDEEADRQAVQRLHRYLYRVARRHVRDAATAEDVVQGTWLAVIATLDRFQGRGTLRTWASRIATNLAITRASRNARCRMIGPALAYRAFAERSSQLAGGLLQATSLSLPVVAGQIGVSLHLIRPENYVAFVCAGLLSVILFPLVALTLLRGPAAPDPSLRPGGVAQPTVEEA